MTSKQPCEEYNRDKNHQQNDESRDKPQNTAVSLGRCHFQLGNSITDRYQILKMLGKGTYGQVLECWDRRCQENVAIKVTPDTHNETAQMEITLLRFLANHDTSGVQGCLRLKDWFIHQNHICMVSERLGPSLYDVMYLMSRRPFTPLQVFHIGKQILSSLRYVHERCCMIHTDLKPGNILMVSSEYNQEATDLQVKLVDFGSAVYQRGYHPFIATTRPYRAPEIILGLKWSYPCDIWSFGCTLFELMTGKILFWDRRINDLNHLRMMKAHIGPLPRWMMVEVVEDDYSNECTQGPSLKDLIQNHSVLSPEIAMEFAHLLEGMLQYDPSSRLTAAQALSHPFFTTYASRLEAEQKNNSVRGSG